MDKIEYRAVIKFFVKEGLTSNKIHSKFIKVYGGSSPSFSTIKKLRKDPVCKRKKKSSSTRTMHRHTKVFWQWEN
jgi:hypothetical protein